MSLNATVRLLKLLFFFSVRFSISAQQNQKAHCLLKQRPTATKRRIHTREKARSTFPSQRAVWLCAQGFYYHQKCNCTVVAEGQGMGGGIRLRDIKYVLSINVQPTSSLYISTAACDFLTWWSYYIPLTPCMSYVSEHNRCRSLLHPRVEMSINTSLGLWGRTRLITEATGLAKHCF